MFSFPNQSYHLYKPTEEKYPLSSDIYCEAYSDLGTLWKVLRLIFFYVSINFAYFTLRLFMEVVAFLLISVLILFLIFIIGYQIAYIRK